MPIDRATVTYVAKQQATRADQLAQMPISNTELSTRRNKLIALYRYDSDLGMQVASIMDAGGSIEASSGSRMAYEQVTYQRLRRRSAGRKAARRD